MVATYKAAKAVGITSIDAYMFPCKSIPHVEIPPFLLRFTNPYS